jgi:hypothetical protein
MPKTYDPQVSEPELVEAWMEAGCYQRSEGKDDCTVVIPPPNVTGVLHMGHAQDGMMALKCGELPEGEGKIPGCQDDLLAVGALVVQSPSEIMGIVAIADGSTHR